MKYDSFISQIWIIPLTVLVSIAIALFLDLVCFIVSGHSDLYNSLF